MVQTSKGSEKIMGERFDRQLESGPEEKLIVNWWAAHCWLKLRGRGPAHAPLSTSSWGWLPDLHPSPSSQLLGTFGVQLVL